MYYLLEEVIILTKKLKVTLKKIIKGGLLNAKKK